uniref:Uncharacterized protein n=1 Tax=Arundo donax TaxID=35708 RepID=A0A0A9DFM3_ARUDO
MFGLMKVARKSRSLQNSGKIVKHKLSMTDRIIVFSLGAQNKTLLSISCHVSLRFVLLCFYKYMRSSCFHAYVCCTTSVQFTCHLGHQYDLLGTCLTINCSKYMLSKFNLRYNDQIILITIYAFQYSCDS